MALEIAGNSPLAVQASKVVLNYHTARAVLEWLEEKVETLEMEEEGGMMYEGEGGLEQ